MPYPVYAFRAVLKQLRNESGLTVLGAAEATGYSNYERWESGATRLGPQHLRSIAGAFAVTDELGLLLYAWLIDRFSPRRGQGSVDLVHSNVAKVLRQLPDDVVDLGEHNKWIVEQSSHADVALLYLVARYRRRQRIVLPPVERSPLPERNADASVLDSAYGDIVFDAARLVGRTMITSASASDISGTNAQRIPLDNLAPMLSSPEAFDAMADELGGPYQAEARRFAEHLRAEHVAIAAIIEAATGAPATPQAVERLVADVAVGRFDEFEQNLQAAAANGALPEVDPALMNEIEAMLDRVAAMWESEAREELDKQSARLDVDGLFDALDLVADGAPRP